MSVGVDTPTDHSGPSDPPASTPPPDTWTRRANALLTPGRHRARWVAVAVLVVAAGLIAVLATRPSATTVEANSPLVGKLAPPVGGVTVDGTQFHLHPAPGRYVLLNFFASWCVPCQVEGPELVAFQFQHQQSGTATVISVVFNDTTSGARSYQRKIGVTWPTMIDPGNAIALAYGVRQDPTSFLIAPGGRVVASITGGATAKGLNSLIAKAEARGYGR